MVNISQFVKDHIPLCACTLGMAIIGYLGYHTIKWIIDKCSKTEKTDRVARRHIAPNNKYHRLIKLSIYQTITNIIP